MYFSLIKSNHEWQMLTKFAGTVDISQFDLFPIHKLSIWFQFIVISIQICLWHL